MSNYSRKTQLNPPSLPPQHNKPSTCTKNINNLTISIYIDIHVTILTYSTRVRNRVKPITLDHTRRTRDREHNRCWNRLIRKKKKKKRNSQTIVIVERDDVEYFVRERTMFLGSYLSGPGFTVLKSNRWRKIGRERGEKVEKKGGKRSRSHGRMEESLTFTRGGILKFTPGRIWMFNVQNGMNKAGWWPKRTWEQFDFSCNGVSKCVNLGRGWPICINLNGDGIMSSRGIMFVANWLRDEFVFISNEK